MRFPAATALLLVTPLTCISAFSVQSPVAQISRCSKAHATCLWAEENSSKASDAVFMPQADQDDDEDDDLLDKAELLGRGAAKVRKSQSTDLTWGDSFILSIFNSLRRTNHFYKIR